MLVAIGIQTEPHLCPSVCDMVMWLEVSLPGTGALDIVEVNREHFCRA
ncbi:MAG: hypothetical protein ACTHQQ_21295 [Solirubrobacteraceae bacterium]